MPRLFATALHRRPIVRPAIIMVATCACLLVATAAVAQQSALADSRRPSDRTVSFSGVPSSQAVADFDSDGAPDIASADRHLGSHGSAQIDVQLSQGSSTSFPLLATEAGVALELLDVDADRDVDIVVTPVISRTILRVLLNDGRGRFSAGTEAVIASAVVRLGSRSGGRTFRDGARPSVLEGSAPPGTRDIHGPLIVAPVSSLDCDPRQRGVTPATRITSGPRAPPRA
jgi:hypothetical protein